MTAWDEQTAMELLYRHQALDNVAWRCAPEYNKMAELLEIPEISDTEIISTEFDLPYHYKTLDVFEYVADLCPENLQCAQRVQTELAMYEARNLIDVLRLMIYIVDTMRKYNVVWGVGRGSSVASYVLYLLGVHRIDSIKYNLDIQEFLR